MDSVARAMRPRFSARASRQQFQHGHHQFGTGTKASQDQRSDRTIPATRPQGRQRLRRSLLPRWDEQTRAVRIRGRRLGTSQRFGNRRRASVRVVRVDDRGLSGVPASVVRILPKIPRVFLLTTSIVIGNLTTQVVNPAGERLIMSPKHESRSSLGRAELELLQFVDAHPGITVGDAATEYGTPRGLARTTILTMMQRLVTKGFLTREQVNSVYRYTARVPASRTVVDLVSEFVSGVLGGSVSPFVAYLSQSRDLSDREVQELRKLVDGLEPRSEAAQDLPAPAPRKRRSSPPPQSGDQ